MTYVMNFVIDRVENIVGKGGNAGNQNFPLFPQGFQKASLRVVKSQDCVVKSLTPIQPTTTFFTRKSADLPCNTPLKQDNTTFNIPSNHV